MSFHRKLRIAYIKEELQFQRQFTANGAIRASKYVETQGLGDNRKFETSSVTS